MPSMRLKTQPALLALAVAAFAASTDAGTGSTSYALPVLPAGGSSTPVDNRFDGRALLHDNAAIAAAFNSKGRKVAVDIGHLTEWSSDAPAFGWVMSLFVAEDGALWAMCDLTAEGLALVEGKKFGYTSPTLRGVFVDSGDWMALSLKSLALTNNPALEMSSTFAAEGEDETDEDEAPETTADDSPAVEDITSLAAQPTVAADTVALSDFTALQATVTALTAERNAATGQVTTLTQQVEQLATELATFRAAEADREAVAAVDSYLTAGKGTPAQREQLLGFARKDLAAFKAFSAVTPVHAAFGDLLVPVVGSEAEVPAEVQEFLAKHNLPLDAYVRGLA